MIRAGIGAVVLASLLVAGCFQKELTPEEKALVAELRMQLDRIETEIAQATAEDESLAGGLVKALISARLEVLKTNQALVEQRINAIEAGSPVKQVTNISPADPELAAQLAVELKKARAESATAQKEASMYGGLVGAMKAATVATSAQTAAMLEQRFLVAKYGLSAPAVPAVQDSPTTAGSSTAEESIPREEVSACANTPTQTERHSCYDALATRHGLSVTPPAPPATGDWHSSSSQDPLTDDTIYTAMLFAESGRSRMRDRPVLVVRCSGNKTDMYINWNDYLGSDAYVTSRVGQEKAITSQWGLSTDKKAAFYPGSPVATLKRLAVSDTFAASITPYNESPITAVFRTAGAEGALSDIRKGCGW